MRSGALRRIIIAMDTATSIRLVLEARLDRESISGALRAQDEEPLRFSGWLGLVAAIDAAAKRSHPGPTGESGRLGGGLLDGRLESPRDQT